MQSNDNVSDVSDVSGALKVYDMKEKKELNRGDIVFDSEPFVHVLMKDIRQ